MSEAIDGRGRTVVIPEVIPVQVAKTTNISPKWWNTPVPFYWGLLLSGLAVVSGQAIGYGYYQLEKGPTHHLSGSNVVVDLEVDRPAHLRLVTLSCASSSPESLRHQLLTQAQDPLNPRTADVRLAMEALAIRSGVLGRLCK